MAPVRCIAGLGRVYVETCVLVKPMKQVDSRLLLCVGMVYKYHLTAGILT